MKIAKKKACLVMLSSAFALLMWAGCEKGGGEQALQEPQPPPVTNIDPNPDPLNAPKDPEKAPDPAPAPAEAVATPAPEASSAPPVPNAVSTIVYKNERGVITKFFGYTYDSLGRPVRIKQRTLNAAGDLAAGPFTDISYDGISVVLEKHDAAGALSAKAKWKMDAASRPTGIDIIDPATGNSTSQLSSTQYTAGSDCSSVSDVKIDNNNDGDLDPGIGKITLECLAGGDISRIVFNFSRIEFEGTIPTSLHSENIITFGDSGCVESMILSEDGVRIESGRFTCTIVNGRLEKITRLVLETTTKSHSTFTYDANGNLSKRCNDADDDRIYEECIEYAYVLQPSAWTFRWFVPRPLIEARNGFGMGGRESPLVIQ